MHWKIAASLFQFQTLGMM